MNTPKKKVLVIGWDAAEWKAIHPLMDAGKMPHLQRLVERGAMGRCATLHPPLSPMLWTSIATGKRPFKHGIHGFTEPTPDGRGVRPITNLSRTTKTIWNILNQNDFRSTVIGWWPSHPAEPINGVMVSDHYPKAHRPLVEGWPLLPNTVHPPADGDLLRDQPQRRALEATSVPPHARRGAELETTHKKRRYHPAITDLLRAQTFAAERRLRPALEILERLTAAQAVGTSILLQSADLLRRLGRLAESEIAYTRALERDPDSAQAYLGICRLALRRHDYGRAADAASEWLGRLYFSPMAHFLRGMAFVGLRDYDLAADSFRTALSQNPHFPQAHLTLAKVLKFRLNDPEGSAEHFRWYREMRRRGSETTADIARDPAEPLAISIPAGLDAPLPPLGDEILIVSGLPRSGTSMLMQMLDAGGMTILTDRLREADEDNPKGYFELEAVKAMFREQGWVAEARGKALKVVAPLVCNLPTGCNYRVILIERDYDELLDSQAKMIARRGGSIEDTRDRRDRLRREYARLIARTKGALGARGDLRLLSLRHEDVIGDPSSVAEIVNRFAGGGLDTSRMSRAVDRSLHRNRRTAEVS